MWRKTSLESNVSFLLLTKLFKRKSHKYIAPISISSKEKWGMEKRRF